MIVTMRTLAKVPLALMLRVPMSSARLIHESGDAGLVSRMKGAFMAPLVADALALATHYEYDASKIRRFYGSIDRYYAPGEKTGGETHGIGWGQRNFHDGNGRGPAKGAGEQTDYGMNALSSSARLASKHPHLSFSLCCHRSQGITTSSFFSI